MAITRGFNRYEVKILGGDAGRVALILCYDNDIAVGRIDFYPDTEKIPDDYLWYPNKDHEYIILHMPLSRFDMIMSIVKERSPLYLYINAERENQGIGSHGTGYLSTSAKDPEGESEGTF